MTKLETITEFLQTACGDPQLSTLTSRQLAVLMFLRQYADGDDVRSPVFSTQDLSRALGVAKPSICRSIKRLEQEGLVVNAKQHGPHGANKLRDVFLTPAGKAKADRLAAQEVRMAA